MSKTKTISILLFLSLTLAGAFLFFSLKKTTVKNGFKRSITNKIVNVQNRIDLDNEYYSLADIGPAFIILYKYKTPNEQLKISIDLKHQKAYTLPLELDKEKLKGINKVSILKDSIYVLTGLNSTVYSMSTDKQKVSNSLLDSSPFFQSDVISCNSFLIRSKLILDGVNRRELKKVDRNSYEIASYIPEKQIDGYFCTDGAFIFDKETNNIIYMYYYRGSFTRLDTNLNIIYKANTIDTVRVAKINLKRIKNQITHAQPPSIVNKRFAIANEKIYINSALKADNDIGGISAQNVETIDVYSLKNGQYIHSFYIPKIDRQKLVEFRVYNSSLVALYKKTLAVFKLSDGF
jgi:hypothetical protein